MSFSEMIKTLLIKPTQFSKRNRVGGGTNLGYQAMSY